MKLITSCSQCIFENIKDPSPSIVVLEINQEGYYDITCDKGHTALLFLQEEPFELLFDSGILALLDGYNREAVASFAASLERFHEFCIRMILLHNGIAEEEIDVAWKTVSKQSERQLGAFSFLYLAEFKTKPIKFDEKNSRFRNNVIHNGHFPNFDETKKYGQAVFSYILEILTEMRENCWDGYGKVVTKRQRDYYRKNNTPEKQISVQTIQTTFDSSSSGRIESFAAAIDSIKSKRNIMYTK